MRTLLKVILGCVSVVAFIMALTVLDEIFSTKMTKYYDVK